MTKDNKNLRPYQIELIKNARYILKSNKSLIIQGSTGMGKTVLASFMLKALAEQNKRGLFICHRRELIEQASKSFNDFNINHAIIGTGYKKDLENPIQICSALSLFNKLDLIKKPDFIIWDECHHIASSTWSKIFNYFPNAHHIGLTATPQRLDGKGLGKFFEKMVQAPPMRELINQGYLSDFDIYAPSAIDLEGVASKNGDYDQEQLSKVVNKPTITGCAIEHYKKICNNKKAIVFCVSINHSLEVVKKFNDAGIKAAHIDGQMTNKQRDELINKFQDGELKILSNVDIVGEGFDLPAIEAAILLRPTQSLTLYLQQVGRALRRSQGKDKAIILDHAGNSLRHGSPDDDFQWSLDNNIKISNGEQKNFSASKVCPQCSLRIGVRRYECDCGYAFIENVKGELELSEIKNKKIHGNLGRGLKFNVEEVKNILILYNQGYSITECANITRPNVTSKKEKTNNRLIVSNLIRGKTYANILPRPINKENWIAKNLYLRFRNSYNIDSNGCFISSYSPNSSSGRIVINVDGKRVNCKRYAYAAKYRELTSKEVIYNACNKPNCVNPDHFEIKTPSERSKLGIKKLLQTRGIDYFQQLSKGLNQSEVKKQIRDDRIRSTSTHHKGCTLTNIDSGEEVFFKKSIDLVNHLEISYSTLYRYKDTDKPYKGYLIKSYLPF